MRILTFFFRYARFFDALRMTRIICTFSIIFNRSYPHPSVMLSLPKHPAVRRTLHCFFLLLQILRLHYSLLLCLWFLYFSKPFVTKKIAQGKPYAIFSFICRQKPFCLEIGRMLVKSKRAARVERVVGVKVLFECFEHVKGRGADRAFKEGRKELADAVVVRKCRA